MCINLQLNYRPIRGLSPIALGPDSNDGPSLVELALQVSAEYLQIPTSNANEAYILLYIYASLAMFLLRKPMKRPKKCLHMAKLNSMALMMMNHHL